MRTGKRRALIAALVLGLAAGVATWQRVRSGARPPAAQSSAAVAEPSAGADRSARAAAAATAAELAERHSGDDPDAPVDEAGAGLGTDWNDPTTAQRNASATREALGRSADPAGPRAIYLLADAPGEDRLSTRVHGVDTGAPRALVLWRVQAGRRVRLAEGFSTSDGALHFPDILVPDELELVVTAAEAGADGTDESDPARVQAGALPPPQLEIRHLPGGALALRVAASRALGSVVLAGPAGEEIARVPLPRTPSPARRVMDVTLPAGSFPGEILVAQELPDGARSAWRAYAIPPPPARDREPDTSRSPGSSAAPAP